MQSPPAPQSGRNKAGWPSRRGLGDPGPESEAEAGERRAPDGTAGKYPLGQTLQDEKEKELSPAQIGDHVFLILDSGRPFQLYKHR